MERTFDVEMDQTIVKEEWMEDEPERSIELDESPGNLQVSVDPTVKCGEIFVRGRNRRFTFICAICSNPFESLGSFGQHVDFHIENDKTLPAECIQKDPLTDPLLFPRLTLIQENEPPIELVDVKREEDYGIEIIDEHFEKPASDQNFVQNKNLDKSSSESRKFPCLKCGRTYKHRQSLQTHAKREHAEKLPCRLCGGTYWNLNALRFHEKTDHGLWDPSQQTTTANLLKLSQCDSGINDDETELIPSCESNNAEPPAIMKFEGKDSVDREKIDCPRCEGTFDSRRSLLIHVRCEHGVAILDAFFNDCAEMKFPCKLCDRSFLHFDSLEFHEKNEHWMENLDEDSNTTEPNAEGEGKFSCMFCNRTYSHMRNLRRHVKIDHGDGLVNGDELTCRYCDKIFPAKTEYNIHVENDHPGTNKFPCPHCPKFFKSATNLTDHVYTHTGERPFKCNDCGKGFANQSNLNVHIRMHKRIKNHTCTFCPKSFVTSTEKKRHEQIHTGERPHQCEECGSRYPCLAKLKEHLDRHRNIKNYKCDICEKQFFTKKMLKDHSAVHSSERPFRCQVCGQSFPRKRALRVHEQLHSDVKKYVCNVCGKAFAQCAGLYSHKKSHSSIKYQISG